MGKSLCRTWKTWCVFALARKDTTHCKLNDGTVSVMQSLCNEIPYNKTSRL
jgi:hypothetical protein